MFDKSNKTSPQRRPEEDQAPRAQPPQAAPKPKPASLIGPATYVADVETH